MLYHYKICGTKIVVSMLKDGNMSGQGRRQTWKNKMDFFRSNFRHNGDMRRLVSTRVCHGTTIKEVDWNSGGIIPDTDCLITRDPKVVLAVNYADCFPVALWDPESGIRSVLHVGFKGAAEEIVALAIGKMISHGAISGSINAFIGPGICQDCYDFGPEAPQKIAEQYHHHLRWDGIRDKYFVDIAGIILQQMAHNGLLERNIINSRLCTSENPRLFSARREKCPIEELQSGVLMMG